MKVVSRNVDLPISKIYPHPDNPRKDVGDLSELAESIKANGIFQNLTVVGGGKGAPTADDYTVIIGHRRLSAAKQAGLKQVPCMVVEMDEREQAATMLLENMQRTDLTVFEQTQGFQMMLDLGETQEDIAKKTGFSKTTIRHRLKLLELDPEELKKSQERQATFSDYIEIEKIKDPKNKTEALKAIGTSSFNYTVQRLITRENARANAEKTRAYFDGKLENISFDTRFKYRQIGHVSMSKELTDEKIKELDGLIERGAKYYTISSGEPEYTWAYFYTDPVTESEEEKAENRKRAELEERRRLREQQIRAEEQRAHILRENFVKDFANRDYIATLTEALLTTAELGDIDYEEVAELLGIELSDDDVWYDIPKKLDYKRIAKQHPESLILAILFTIHEASASGIIVHNHEGRYVRNVNLENWYRILTNVGYMMSRDERMLLDGTHKCFGGERNE